MSGLKATDLRIGNIVQTVEHKEPRVVASLYGDSEYIEHTHIGIPMSEEGLWDDSKIEPIPLSPEVLEKCGFKVRESSTCKEWYIGTNDVTHDWLFSVTWLDRPELIKAPDAPFYRNGRHTVYYLHQLQNLYFALTGEELQYNPE